MPGISLVIVVISGFIAAVGAPLFVRIFGRWSGWVLASVPAGIFAYLCLLTPQILSGSEIYQSIPWVSSLDINLSFRLDGLGLLFAWLISGIGALVSIYARSYMAGRQDLGRFYLYFLSFMAAMLGVVLADNLLILFVFWELTSITSYLLIGFDHDQESSRDGALKALLITGGGGLVMLAGFVLVGLVFDTNSISVLLQAQYTETPLVLAALGLILIGAFTKSAQWPFHIWLPDAMQAPTPVSAYLHSATMVKAGIYLLARLSPLFADSLVWFYVVTSIGMITMLAGGFLALKQTDLKAILAYTTIGWLGTLVMLLGLGNKYAIEAVTLGVLTHALYKGALFLLVGGIDHETGTRDIRKLGLLGKDMPITALFMGITAFSMAGIPLLLGFIAKELLLEAALTTSFITSWLTPVAVVVASLLNVAIALRIVVGIFFAPVPERENPDSAAANATHVHDPYFSMLIGPGILAGLTIIFGLVPGWLNSLITQASRVILDEEPQVKLAIWHGINPALILSILAISAGVGLFFIYNRSASLVSVILPRFFDRLYDLSLKALAGGSLSLTRFIQNGTLRFYLMTILLASTVFVSYGLLSTNDQFFWPQVAPPNFTEYILSGALIITAIFVTQAKGRLTAIAGLGVIGAIVSLFFVLFSAPDLALTQLIIETLMVIVFLLVFHFLPRFFKEYTPRIAHARDVLISGFVGLAAAGLVIFATANHFQGAGVSNYYIENSYELAYGKNVVNVILVDFRGFDTLGEITVLTIAAIGIFALLKVRPKRQPQGDDA
jgi:multicomponent Na+:H+ antiporter subunit A